MQKSYHETFIIYFDGCCYGLSLHMVGAICIIIIYMIMMIVLVQLYYMLPNVRLVDRVSYLVF